MPLYEYACQGCGGKFELLIRSSQDQPRCPECDSVRLQKLLSVPAAHTKGSSLPVCDPTPRSGGCGLPQCGQGGCQGMF